ncbi:MAG: hypothetical protein M3Q56_01685 [Bacteroidota bacterium]|nr:hypothetical protein [Bacteroidota bacterium]
MELFFDVLKYTLPAFVVFLTVYFMLKMYLQEIHSKRMIDHQKHMQPHALPLKLQSYERLSLFLERIRIPHLLMRFKTPDLKSRDLCHTLILGVQQEYEHNYVQQIYVSDTLWEIILLAKEEVLHAIDQAGQLSSNEGVPAVERYLLEKGVALTDPVINKALSAIKKEIQLLL